jgi:ADP-ribosylglycohydrolase
MLGSIIGDIVGSIYEFNNIKTKEFPLFSPKAEFTDDSILTLATADWLLHGGESGEYYQRYAVRYPHPMGAYGTSFQRWVMQSRQLGAPAPAYQSCGNGSAMRVGPVGWAFQSEEKVREFASLSAECTHNHPEGIKGAQATALCILMARQKADKEDIRRAIEEEFGYDLHTTCDRIRPTYGWEGTCQKSVPQALVAFLDGTSFEDCLRNAISLGGDSDTIGCITGSVAEAYYGIPKDIYDQGMSYLTPELRAVVQEFEEKYGPTKQFK